MRLVPRRRLLATLLICHVAGCVTAEGDTDDAEPSQVSRDATTVPLGDTALPGADEGPAPGADTGLDPDSDAGPPPDLGLSDATPPDAADPPDQAIATDALPVPPDAPAPPSQAPCLNEGARRACPPADLEACPEGTQTCEAGFWSECRGPAERCNGADDDCDAEIDEGIGLGEACTAGIGACGREGVGICAPDGSVVCQGQPGLPSPELCDAIDNDCDGTTDEDFGLGGPCEAGVGACRRDGVEVCAPGGSACNAVPGEPVEEACNDLDDDCDGQTDEGFALGSLCEVGVGACARQGQLRCGLGGVAICSALAGAPVPELCNGLDDDCDGETDEGFDLGAPCEGGAGACAERGVLICDEAGEIVCSVRPGAPEVCDAVDNDCDGAIDEGFAVGERCVAGAGACTAEGIVECTVRGAAQCSAVAPFDLDAGDGSDGELVVGPGERVTLEPDRPYQFSRLEVQANGVLALRARNPGEIGRLSLRVSGPVLVRAGGRIDLDGAGHPGGPPNPKVVRDYPGIWTNGGGTNGVHGQGPGGGGGGWSSPQQVVGSGGGAGYARPGDDGTPCGQDDRDYTVWDDNLGMPVPIAIQLPRYSAGGDPYGDALLDALEPGSGGGAGANNYDGGEAGVGGAGGPGGGALRLVTTSLTVEAGGEISADGGPGEGGVNGNYVGGGGGGSGGALFLSAVVFHVEGSLTATGGAGAAGSAGSTGGQGSDGRIRIDAGIVESLGAVQPAPGHQGDLDCRL